VSGVAVGMAGAHALELCCVRHNNSGCIKALHRRMCTSCRFAGGRGLHCAKYAALVARGGNASAIRLSLRLLYALALPKKRNEYEVALCSNC
jgi:hypothetical protein